MCGSRQIVVIVVCDDDSDDSIQWRSVPCFRCHALTRADFTLSYECTLYRL